MNRKAIPAFRFLRLKRIAASFFQTERPTLFFDTFALHQRSVYQRQRVISLREIYAGNAEQTAQFIGRHSQRPWPRCLTRLRLRKSGRHCRMERDISFHFLHRLMDMTVQHRDGAKPFQISQGLRRVFCSPAPLRIDRPKRNMGENHYRRTRGKTLQFFFQPRQLLFAQQTQSATVEVQHVHERDEVDAVLSETVPAAAFCPFPVTRQILLSIIG